MKTLLEFVKTTIIGGLMFLIPIVLLILVLDKALVLSQSFVAPLFRHFPRMQLYGISVVVLAAIIALLIVSFMAGVAARTVAGQHVAQWLENAIMSKLPGYSMYRSMIGDMARSVASLDGGTGVRAVFAEMDDGAQIGFVVDEMDDGRLAVFVPGAPSPLSGSLYFLDKERARDSGMSVSEATAVLRRIGVGSGKLLHGKT